MFGRMGNLLAFVLRHPLNRFDRSSALIRLLRWQIAARSMEAAIAFPFVADTRLLARRGQAGATGNWYCGLHDFEEMAFLLHATRQKDLFVDVGANVGSYTVLVAGATGADVVAIEPVPATFADLQANIGMNKLADRVSAYQLGISDKDGELLFTSNSDAMNRVTFNPGKDSVAVTVTSLDTLLHDKRPNFIKIDVEGHEMHVLRGAKETLKAPCVRAVILETNGMGRDFNVKDDDLRDILVSYEFIECDYDPHRRNLIPRSAATVRKNSKNSIFVRNPPQVQDLCRSSPRYRLVNGYI